MPKAAKKITPIEKDTPQKPVHTDKILEHVLQDNHRQHNKGHKIAEHQLLAADRGNTIAEHSMEAHGRILDESKKTNDHLAQIAAKPDVQKVEIEPGDENEIAKTFWNMLRGRTGPQGEKGDKGDPLTWDDLTESQKNYLKGIEGHTPTSEELLALIKPLIPEVKDGETPSDEKLISLIKPLIDSIEMKEAEDGHTPTKEELLALIEPLMPKLEKMEKEKPLTADDIIKLIKGKISFDHLDSKTTPNFEALARKISSKTVSLSELDDVDLTGLTKKSGKYQLGSGTGSGGGLSNYKTFTASGGTSYILDSIPKGVVQLSVDGVMQTPSTDYQWTNASTTATTTVAYSGETLVFYY